MRLSLVFTVVSMNPIPYIPETAPFSPEQRAWLNGFLAGLHAYAPQADVPVSAPSAPAANREPLLVLYGSQTGTAEGLAKRVAKESEQRGFTPKLMELNACDKAILGNAGKAVIISSTWGDGEPPDNAVAFWAWLNDAAAPRLESLKYAVLGLGDKNYGDFCGASRKFDERLTALGATRLLSRTECDVDYEAPAKDWIEQLWKNLVASTTSTVALNGGNAGLVSSASIAEPAAPEAFSKKNPFPAELVHRLLLNKPGSAKQVFHHEINLAGSGLDYEAGDALGVCPKNCPELVDQILAAIGAKGDETHAVGGSPISLREALMAHYDIQKPSSELLAAVAALAADSELVPLLVPERAADLKAWLFGRDVLDVLKLANGKLGSTQLLPLLRKLAPRLYSISSSPKAHPGEVHLTVGAVRYEAHGRVKKGVASIYLAERAGGGEKIRVFVQKSHGFRLPADHSLPVIMVGPGTGIAPFRAFLEEREVAGGKGKNWLFFGDQKRGTDFLYEEQIMGWTKSGLLSRLDLAFSRDQAEKIYVQDRMMENAAELWKWLSEGAYFYVCGDASRMAKDVDKALHSIAEKAGGLSTVAAAEFVARLKTEKRYQRDVY